jgi:hypothetical protein
LDPEKTVEILKLLRIWLWEKAQHLFESQEVRRDNESFFSIAIGIKLEAGAKRGVGW